MIQISCWCVYCFGTKFCKTYCTTIIRKKAYQVKGSKVLQHSNSLRRFFWITLGYLVCFYNYTCKKIQLWSTRHDPMNSLKFTKNTDIHYAVNRFALRHQLKSGEAPIAKHAWERLKHTKWWQRLCISKVWQSWWLFCIIVTIILQ